MAKERVRIQKESYRSDQFNNLVDREFKTFVKPELVVPLSVKLNGTFTRVLLFV